MVGADDGFADGDIDGAVLGSNDKDGVDDGFVVGRKDWDGKYEGAEDNEGDTEGENDGVTIKAYIRAWPAALPLPSG